MQRTLFDLTHKLTEFNIFEIQCLEDILYISNEQENRFRHFVSELIISIDCLPLQLKKLFAKGGILDHPWIEPTASTITRIAKMKKVSLSYVIQRYNALNCFLENRMRVRGFRYYGPKLNINDVIIEMRAILKQHESFDLNFTTNTAKHHKEKKRLQIQLFRYDEVAMIKSRLICLTFIQLNQNVQVLMMKIYSTYYSRNVRKTSFLKN